jgi:subtilisin family serine protease
LRVLDSEDFYLTLSNDQVYVSYIFSPRNFPLLTLHLVTGVSVVKATCLTGKGRRIGTIDSGVEYTHPALDAGFRSGHKIVYGYGFIGDDYSKTGIARRGLRPMDYLRHVTYVAGVIGAITPDFVGVVHEATLGAYRVVDCHGSGDLALL